MIDAAGFGRRSSGWFGSRESINTIHDKNAPILRARSHQSVLNNPYSARIASVLVSNLVGNGIVPRPKIKDPDVKNQVQELWDEWVSEADASGSLGFYGLQAQIVRAMIESGECFIRLQNSRSEDNLAVPLQLQVVEPEFLSNKNSFVKEKGFYIKDGIEFDSQQRRIAYHFYQRHPSEGGYLGQNSTIRIPADEIIHVFNPTRPGQIRGWPWFTPVLTRLRTLDEYDDAELARKKITAMFAGFITRPDMVGEDDSINSNSLSQQRITADPTMEASLEPGALQVLTPGDEIKFAAPADVGANYEAFIKVQQRAIAVGTGLTYEQLSGDLSGVNYSSIRAGTLEQRRWFKQIQHTVIIHQLCRPVWRRWIEIAIECGKVQSSDLREYYQAIWTAPSWEWVDPYKEINAHRVALQAGLTSRDAVVRANGGDIQDLDQTIKNDNDRAAGLDLKFNSNFSDVIGIHTKND